MAWGNLQKPEQHVGVDYKTLNEGYFESGIELNQIFKDWDLPHFTVMVPINCLNLKT
jgi:hypothetical protein